MLFLIIAIGGIAGMGYMWQERQALLEDVSENSKVIGALLDDRKDEAVAEDINRTGEPMYYSAADWMKNGIEETDLYGWDDHSIQKYLNKSEKLFNSFIADFESKLDLNKAKDFKSRVKALNSLIGKMRQKNRAADIRRMIEYKDLGGVRIVTYDLDEINYFKEGINKSYQIQEEKDYIKKPLVTGYMSWHAIVNYNGHPFEVQVRTCDMEVWASWAHNTLYKDAHKAIAIVGEEKFLEFEDYGRDMSAYIKAKAMGENPALPARPEKLEVLRQILPEKYLKYTHEDGTLNFESCKR